MSKQTIIAIGREYGSGGHQIAELIAKDLGFKLYDRSMLDEIANDMNVNVEKLAEYDEKPRNVMTTRKVGKFSNSMEEILAELQIEFIQNKAREGESFVIVGRCADSILQGVDGLITIFVNGNRECKVKRVMEKYNLSELEAYIKMERHDRKRRKYHARYSNTKWGDSRYYDLCINSSPLGIEGTANVLKSYITDRIAARED